MADPKPTTMLALRKFALRLPETEEGVACEGTALEARTFRTAKKSFLFLRAADARLKLDASLKEAAALAEKDPKRFEVGTGGWVLVKLDHATDAIDRLERWVTESHGLFRPAKAAAVRSVKRSPAKAKRGR